MDTLKEAFEMSWQLRAKTGSFGTFAFNKKLFFLTALTSEVFLC